MAYDSQRQVSVLFGGTASTTFSDTWEWNGSNWIQRISNNGNPAGRGLFALAYDSARGRTVMYGGYTGQFSAETWEWDGQGWNFRSDLVPTTRSSHAMVYDVAHTEVLLFGGLASPSGTSNDTWGWNGSNWTQHASTGPSRRYSHAMAFDSARNVVVLFGGYSGTTNLGDTWEWDGTAWALRSTTGPAPRSTHCMAYDSQRAVTVLFGSVGASDTWEWNGSTWTQLAITGPPGRSGTAMVYDSHRHAMVLFGGSASGTGAFLGDTWELQTTCTPPSIMTHPDSGAVCQSSSASFTVAATGTSPLTYQWQVQTGLNSWAAIGNDPLPLPCGGFAHASPYDAAVTSIGLTPCNGQNHYLVRCVVTNPCGSTISAVAALIISSADFNGDGDTGTDQDIDAFFACLGGNCCPTCGSADFNGDGDVGTDQDIESFFRVLAGGSC